MNQNFGLAIVFLILGFSVWNAVNDAGEMEEHHQFFESMQNFTNKGARFTADDGAEMDKRISAIEEELVKQDKCNQ